jgi:hypothetical protein
VPLIGYCTNGPQYCLVYEYLQRGSLLEAIACVVSAHQLSYDLVKLLLDEMLKIPRACLCIKLIFFNRTELHH